MRKNPLPFAVPDLDEREIEAVASVLRSGWITMGKRVVEFEDAFAEFVGARHSVAVNSCTAALHLALDAAGLKRGDFVITTPFTFAATAEVVRYFDATPIFVDVDPATLNMDPEGLKAAIKDTISCLGGRPRNPSIGRAIFGPAGSSARRPVPGQIRAIIPVHYAGLPCEMDAISSIAAEYGLAVIEDAAHAFPATFKGRRIGSTTGDILSRASCFSFYATKTLTTGEGGMLTTESEDWAQRFRYMRLHGISSDAWKRYSVDGSWRYDVVAPGFKYNMTDIAAAMGLVQLQKAAECWERRKKIAARYNEAFSRHPAFEIPTELPDAEHAWHLYPLRLHLENLKVNRSEFLVELGRRKICASVHFIPLHIHRYYRETYGYEPEDFPVAYREFQREVSLPIFSKMTDQDAGDVIEAVLSIAAEHFQRKFRAVT